jgi:phage FluMu protein Com
MQTVTFKCPHCSKLMGVGAAHLGQQVRCPHCQQVVMAPASAATGGAAPPPAPPAAPTPAAPPPAPDLFNPAGRLQEHESIFGPPPHDEDLFGAGPAPRLEIPQEPTWPQAPPPPAPLEPTIAFPSPPPEAQTAPPPGSIFGPAPVGATLTYVPPEGRTTPDGGLHPNNLADQGEPARPQQEPPPTLADADLADQEAPAFVAPTVPRPQRKDNSPWIMAIIIVPLVSYSVAITVLFLMMYLQKPKEQSPFDVIPDDAGNVNDGARKVNKTHTRVNWKRIPLEPLPDRLKVGLGETLQVGSVAVKPLKVELRKVTIYRRPYPKGEFGTDESLVLYLELRNVSEDVAFCPLDPNFDREWKNSFESGMPFTYLEKGGQRFYGGPAKLVVGGRDPVREDLEITGTEDDPNKKLSQQVEKELLPGEKMETFVCTAPHHKIAGVLAGYDGPLLYRVQVRRGLVTYKGQERSATCVVGVTFTGKDVKHVTASEPKDS